MTVRETCLIEVKKCHKSIEGNFMMKTVLLFFVLINFQSSAKHISVLPCYFMKREHSLETLNFENNFQFHVWPKWHCINFSKSGKWFWCSHNCNWLSNMIDKDDITSVNVKIWEDPLESQKELSQTILCLYSKDIKVLGYLLHSYNISVT